MRTNTVGFNTQPNPKRHNQTSNLVSSIPHTQLHHLLPGTPRQLLTPRKISLPQQPPVLPIQPSRTEREHCSCHVQGQTTTRRHSPEGAVFKEQGSRSKREKIFERWTCRRVVEIVRVRMYMRRDRLVCLQEIMV